MCFVCACRPAVGASYNNLGIPAGEYYFSDPVAKCILDMAIYDEKLYIGCGDYDGNAGPVPVLYCDLDSLGNWQTEEYLPDEQITKYLMIDGKLTVPGADPVGSPSLGTYYQRDNGEWKTISGLLEGLHNFDLIEYEGKLFAGIGASAGSYPIVCSEDGENFEAVPMFRDNEPLSTQEYDFIRTYDLFVLNDALYATLSYHTALSAVVRYEIYRYHNGAFVFDNDWSHQLVKRYWQVAKPIAAKEYIAETLFFSIDRLYATSNMNTVTQVSLPGDPTVYDIAKYDDVLYVLTAVKQEVGYTVEVYRNTTGKLSDFKLYLSFEYELPPTAFTLDNRQCFIAMGDIWKNEAGNGTVLCVKSGRMR